MQVGCYLPCQVEYIDDIVAPEDIIQAVDVCISQKNNLVTSL